MDSPVPHPQLKNRIFGAILLVILAVLLIPLFLGEPRNSIDVEQSEEKKQFQSKIQPLPDSEDSVAAEVVEQVTDSLKVGSSQVTEQEPTGLVLKKIDMSSEVAEPKKVGQDTTDLTATKLKIEPAKEESSVEELKQEPVIENKVTEGWALQAGIFSKKENAQSIAKILKDHDFKPNSSVADASFGEAVRVWLGPFRTKEEAQATSTKLESIIGNGGYIAPYPFK